MRSMLTYPLFALLSSAAVAQAPTGDASSGRPSSGPTHVTIDLPLGNGSDDPLQGWDTTCNAKHLEPVRDFCIYTQPYNNGEPLMWFNILYEGLKVENIPGGIQSLVKHDYTPRVKIFSKPDFKGQCRLIGPHYGSGIRIVTTTPFVVFSLKAVAANASTADCPNW